ncbi:MAG: hypothetical protein JST10_11525 [Bacteroidetes bacterium]|nr:hypothetical protein [Bacteroidota bacterium]MBS1633188.1 hypothetical protein [Bacteroidota bacterium]
METKTKIIVSRSSEWLNRMRSYKIIINSDESGSVKNGGSEEFSVLPGSNTVQCKLGWYSSRPFTLDIKEGETVYLRVRSGMKLYWPLFMLVVAGLVLMFYFRSKTEKPEWLMPVSLALIMPAIFYTLYYSIFGRKDYLLLQKDSKNIFA